MRFHYTFQKVVDLKGNEKTQAEWMLSSALGELQAQEKSLDELIGQRSTLMFSCKVQHSRRHRWLSFAKCRIT